MAVPHTVTDGRYTPAVQIGPDRWNRPFMDQGDGTSFEVMRKYRVDYSTYTPGTIMTPIVTKLGIAYLVSESETQEIGNGLLEFDRVYASIPVQRAVGTSLVYELQVVNNQVVYNFSETPTAPEVAGIPLQRNATEVWDYAINAPPPALEQPYISVVNNRIFTFGNWGQFTPGQQVLAADTDSGIYKGRIYYRRSVYITWPNIATQTFSTPGT